MFSHHTDTLLKERGVKHLANVRETWIEEHRLYIEEENIIVK